MDAALNVPFFSIILPVYNGDKFLPDAIQSVLQQSFTSWELIIIDDGSTDGTANIVTHFCRIDRRIKSCFQPNKKQAAARNTGMKISSGKWLAFIDADDLWLPAKLELQYQCIKRNDTLDVVFSDGYTKYQSKKIKVYYHYDIVKGFWYGKDLYKKMLFGNYIPNLSVVVKSSSILQIGMQDESLPGVEDHDYWLKLCRVGANFYGMKERLFIYRLHDDNFSSNLLNQDYLSLIMRIKNFDRGLLNDEEIKRFKIFFFEYQHYFLKQGKTEWVSGLKSEYRKLNISPISTVERLSVRYSKLSWSAKFRLNTFKKRCKLNLLKVIYFYPKKKITDYKDRLAVLYINWLNSRSPEEHGLIKLSSTAKINFFDQKGSSLDVQSLYLGDFSIINFIEEESKIIAGADISIGKFCNFNIVGQVILGNNVLFNNYSALNCHNEIIIGDDSWFGEGVKLYDHNHKYKDRNIPFTQQGYNNGKIEIGSNVWVGSNTVILQNVSIGDGCVIGANNVIYKSLSPNTILKSNSMGTIDIIK